MVAKRRVDAQRNDVMLGLNAVVNVVVKSSMVIATRRMCFVGVRTKLLFDVTFFWTD